MPCALRAPESHRPLRLTKASSDPRTHRDHRAPELFGLSRLQELAGHPAQGVHVSQVSQGIQHRASMSLRLTGLPGLLRLQGTKEPLKPWIINDTSDYVILCVLYVKLFIVWGCVVEVKMSRIIATQNSIFSLAKSVFRPTNDIFDFLKLHLYTYKMKFPKSHKHRL